MSKTVRGILRGPGPYYCLYSPECVEGRFSEVGLPLYGVLRSSAIAEACSGRSPKRRRGSGHCRGELVCLAS
jgi:hypothetical protein